MRDSEVGPFSTPPGWYPDGDGWERRWDGSGWTDERRRMAEPAPPTQVRPSPPAPSGPTYGQLPPTGFGSHGTPGPPPYGGPTRGMPWLWLTLGLVVLLGIGTGVTLGLLQPWEGDEAGTGGTGGDPAGGDGEAAPAAVGDVNGDGKGDAVYYVYYSYDNVKKITATSNGEAFETSQLAVDPRTEPSELYLDWDADGVTDELTWTFVGSGDQITVSSSDPDFPGEQTHTMSLSTLKEYGDIRIQVDHGDFDGDGDEDLAIAGPNGRVVDVSVMLNDGKGTFAAPVLWLSIPNAVIDATLVRAGDFDRDGDDDLWAQLPAERLKDKDYTGYYSGDRGHALLRSSGRGFELGAINKSTVHHDELLVGDVTGDGTDHVVGVESNTYDEEVKVTVYDFSSGRLEEVPGFTGTSDVGRRSLMGATLSDVDGDGDGDVVYVVKSYEETRFTGVQVMRSTGAAFESATVWADTPTCKDDRCRIEFPSPRRY